ncbi:hypothetical protein OJJOAM_001127 [Cupriavidus sp. H18C1]|uniref:BrnA antitoxin family protein n=1 Tax=Cupriavidus sp. H18C1 TaxID=3241601 RepID=UPI003BB96B75
MQENKRTTRQHSLESDDAPELDAHFFREADLYEGKRLVRRGRPKQAQTKQHVSLRLSPEVLAVFRSSGKGLATPRRWRLEGISCRTPSRGRRRRFRYRTELNDV